MSIKKIIIETHENLPNIYTKKRGEMNLLEEYKNGIRGLKLQANVVMESLTNNLQIDKSKLAKAHDLLNPNILQSKLIKQFMKEKNIFSFVDINVDILEQWIDENFKFDYSKITSISTSKESNEIHFSSGYQKLKDDETVDYLELSSYVLCNKQINFFGGYCATNTLNNRIAVEKFVQKCGLDIKDICPKCLELCLRKLKVPIFRFF